MTWSFEGEHHGVSEIVLGANGRRTALCGDAALRWTKTCIVSPNNVVVSGVRSFGMCAEDSFAVSTSPSSAVGDTDKQGSHYLRGDGWPSLCTCVN